jgi:hypothetical protein
VERFKASSHAEVSLRALILALSGGLLDFSQELTIDFVPPIEIFASNPAQLQPAGWGATDHPAQRIETHWNFTGLPVQN